jgi:hypothetical protein
MRRRGAISEVLMIVLGLAVLGLVVVGIGVGLSSAISTLFQKNVQVGLGDDGKVSIAKITKVVFVGDDVIKAAAGGWQTLTDKEAGTPSTLNDQMKSTLTSIGVEMDSVAIAGQNSLVTIDKGFSPAITQSNHGIKGVVFMFSKNDTDTAAAKQNIDKLLSQASSQSLISFGILLPTVGGDANYTKEINLHLKSKSSTIQLIDATGLRPTNNTDPTTIPLDRLQSLIKEAINSWNTQPVGGTGTYATGDVLPVPLYDQMTKWGNYPLGGGWCGVTSVKMALDYYAKLNYSGLRDVGNLNDRYYSAHYVHISTWQTNAAWEHYLTNGQRFESRLDANDWRKAKEILAAGHPIVSYGSWTTGGGHIVVIIGVGANTVSYADPIGGKVKTVSKAKASNYLVATMHSYKDKPYYMIDTQYATNRLR